MQVSCPSCRAKILADDLNLQNLLARCRGCGSVFSFRSQLEADDPAAARVPAARRGVPLPARFRIERVGDRTTIFWRWFGPRYFILALFCAAWDSFLVFWYLMALKDNAPWIMTVFPIVHLAVGVGLTYYTLTGFFNRTFVTVDGRRVAVKHGPLPIGRNHDLAADELKQVYCAEQKSGGMSGPKPSSYNLNAVTRDGRKLTLIRGLDEPEQALYLEELIEVMLGIPDERVPGEMP
jgi:hypothetical protein